ncbi:hypothetical protein Glove_208g125 [Diversispora epigaea]|uniref:Protein kinase domain-containing protein n=1 Tax=Diversispora epigaea TaxID=1348612 RepID=A0A397ILL5_9GLOM|nr:hypothetical protein Glove_208g125 [Diversispora epigaea]
MSKHKKLMYCPAGHSGDFSYDRHRLDFIDIKNGECNMCTKEHLIKDFGTWSSGNVDIDKIIQDSQIKDFYSNLQWIPYDNLSDIKHVSDNEYYVMRFAELKNCVKYSWDFIKQDWKIYHGGSVALKELKGHIHDILEFIKGIKNIIIDSPDCITRFHGISKNPSTQNYIIIMEWDYPFTIGSFFVDIFLQVDWETKIKLLHHTLEGLNTLHRNNLVHGELHRGNILMSSGEPFSIAALIDPGLCKSTNDLILNSDNKNKKNISGLIPFIPPEVLRGNDFTKEGDIYSFGGVMYEIAVEIEPFVDVAHDTYLMIDICNGVRPKIPDMMLNLIPKWYLNLMYKCWNDDPSKRPTAHELNNLLQDFDYSDAEDNIEIMNTSHSQKLLGSLNKVHPQSCYTDRRIFTLYELQDLLEDIKSGKREDPNLLKPNEPTVSIVDIGYDELSE